MLGYKSNKNFLLTYGLIFFLAIVGFVVRYFKVYNGMNFNLQVVILFVSIAAMSFSWESLRGVNIWLNKVFPFERNITGRILIQLSIGAAIGLTLRFLIFLFGEPIVPFKMDSLFLATTWALYIILPVGVNLGFFLVYFIDRWKDSIVHTERLEKEKSMVQFDNLKNQLNPHFLFNALTSLNSLIYEDKKLASEFLLQLSKVYRYVLANKDKNFVSLKTELDFIRHYVSLLETRFKNALEINFKITVDAEERAVVPVTLQILIENALKHNIADKERPLVIDIFIIGDYLVVSNKLQLRKDLKISNKQGLENLKSLYRFLTERPVLVEPTDDWFYVKVPLL
jgi:hypothetical protein